MNKSNILKKFGARVRELRQQNGAMSQMAFAQKVGIDRTYIGGVERGERNLGLENIEKIAKALGVGIDEMFKP